MFELILVIILHNANGILTAVNVGGDFNSWTSCEKARSRTAEQSLAAGTVILTQGCYQK